ARKAHSSAGQGRKVQSFGISIFHSNFLLCDSQNLVRPESPWLGDRTVLAAQAEAAAVLTFPVCPSMTLSLDPTPVEPRPRSQEEKYRAIPSIYASSGP